MQTANSGMNGALEYLQKHHDTYETRYRGWIAAELELVLAEVNGDGHLVYSTRVHDVLVELTRRYPDMMKYFGCEFWGGQLEVRTDPHPTVGALVAQLQGLVEIARGVARSMGYRLIAVEWIPWQVHVSYELSPIKERYAEYASEHPDKVPAMCRVASLQFHVGVGNRDEAIVVYNRLADVLPKLVDEGWVHPERHAAFEGIIFPQWFPPKYETEADIYRHAVKRGFDKRPALNYSAVRIHPQGSAELRIGGATDNWSLVTARATRFLEIAGADAR